VEPEARRPIVQLSETSAVPSRPDEVYVARQPIHTRSVGVVGYELLFRDSAGASGFPTTALQSGDSATAQVLQTSLLTIGLDELTGGKRAFVNFPRASLLAASTTELPSDRLVVEVLEDVTPDSDTVEACRQLRERGFKVALDDYTWDPRVASFVDEVDIVKVDVRQVGLDAPSLADDVADLRRRGKQVLAEKVEHRWEFERALSLGFDLFQGYFWGTPEIRPGRQIPASAHAYLRVLEQVGSRHFDIGATKAIVRSDPGLMQALLRYINSGLFRWMDRIDSVHRAIVILGRDEIRRWAAMLALNVSLAGLPRELVRSALVRARFCELVATELGGDRVTTDLFMAGLFSRADSMLGLPLDEALAEIPIEPHVREAILVPAGELGRLVQCAAAYERGDWVTIDTSLEGAELSLDTAARAYRGAVAWADAVLDGPTTETDAVAA
jgi:c-di-GMP-related signal transduction protein